MRKLQTVIESSPFIRMQNEQQYWTGYDANLIDEAIKRGTELEQENRRFREFSPQEARQIFWSGWRKFWKVILSITITIAVCGGIAIGIAAAVHADKYGEGYKVGAKDATIAAITFVEAQNRHVSPAQIRLELPYGTEIFNKIKWFEKNVYENHPLAVALEQYDQMMLKPYVVFVTPVDEILNKDKK
jgi:ABC-type xylose transport system substrate-binding protein